MSAPLQEGDIAVLRSGGPPMTVAHIEAEGKGATCQWFAAGEVREHRFLIHCLNPSEPDTPMVLRSTMARR